MRLTTKGQVTIPLAIRQKLGLHAQTEVVFDIVGDSVRIRKARQQSRGSQLVKHLKGRGTSRLTTDEILALTRS